MRIGEHPMAQEQSLGEVVSITQMIESLLHQMLVTGVCVCMCMHVCVCVFA